MKALTKGFVDKNDPYFLFSAVRHSVACDDTNATLRPIFFCPHVAAAWVAVGENGTIINSTDGLTWSSATSATAETLRGVYFDGVGTWAAAGQQGTIVNSPDAVVWTQRTSGNTNPL